MIIDGLALSVTVGVEVAAGATVGDRVGASDAPRLAVAVADADGARVAVAVCGTAPLAVLVCVVDGLTAGVWVAVEVAVDNAATVVTVVAVGATPAVIDTVGVAGHPDTVARVSSTSSSMVIIPLLSRSPGQSPPQAPVTAVSNSSIETTLSPFKSPGQAEHCAPAMRANVRSTAALNANRHRRFMIPPRLDRQSADREERSRR
jgi:hypothetical protein